MADDRFIDKVSNLVSKSEKDGLAVRRRQFPPVFDSTGLLKNGDRGVIIGAANTVIELGHPACPSLCFGLVTERDDLVTDDRVTLIGEELQDLSHGRHAFALIVVAKVREANENSRQALLRKMSSGNLLTGCMVRVASERIWIRFSQEALDGGLTLATFGWLLLSELKKEQSRFEKAEVILVAAGGDQVNRLRPVYEGQAEERSTWYRNALVEKMECTTGLDCEQCPETATCQILKDAVAISRKKQKIAQGKT